jgi:hypothetical protein
MWHAGGAERAPGARVEIRDRAPLVAVPDGRSYRVVSPPSHAMVTESLGGELSRVLERFARGAGFDELRPVSAFFKPGMFGHHRVGRAADIYAVGGVGVDRWKTRWDEALRRALDAGGEAGARAADAERTSNLGWRLYTTMATEGRWAQPYGYPIQLFGPWTRTEGPWKYISDRLLFAHRDHIHVAK